MADRRLLRRLWPWAWASHPGHARRRPSSWPGRPWRTAPCHLAMGPPGPQLADLAEFLDGKTRRDRRRAAGKAVRAARARFFRRFLGPGPFISSSRNSSSESLPSRFESPKVNARSGSAAGRLLTDRRHQHRQRRRKPTGRQDESQSNSPTPRALYFTGSSVRISDGIADQTSGPAAPCAARESAREYRFRQGPEVALEQVRPGRGHRSRSERVGDCGERQPIQHPAHDHPADDPRLGVDLEIRRYGWPGCCADFGGGRAFACNADRGRIGVVRRWSLGSHRKRLRTSPSSFQS